jgi:hypothetical protein
MYKLALQREIVRNKLRQKYLTSVTLKSSGMIVTFAIQYEDTELDRTAECMKWGWLACLLGDVMPSAALIFCSYS